MLTFCLDLDGCVHVSVQYVCVRGRVCSHPLQVAVQDPLAPSYTPHPAAEHWCYYELTHTSAQAGSHQPRVPFLLERTIKHIWNYNISISIVTFLSILHWKMQLKSFFSSVPHRFLFDHLCSLCFMWMYNKKYVLDRNAAIHRLECSQYNTVRLGICWQSFTLYSTTQDFTLDVHCGHGLNHCETLDF